VTIAEATGVNVVVAHMIGQKLVLDAIGLQTEEIVDIKGWAVALADRAHKVLNAGLDGKRVTQLWDGGK
jgi:hypothetical protein